MLENFKLNHNFKKIKKQMSTRERTIFDLIYYSGEGMTKKEIERCCGYTVSGWVISRFKTLGIDLRVRNHHFYIRELF